MKRKMNITKSENSRLQERIKLLEMKYKKIKIENKKLKSEVLRINSFEKKNLEMHARLNRIFEESEIGMTLTDLKGNFTQVNPAFCEMLKYSEKELLSKSIADITFHEDHSIQKEFEKNLYAGKIKSYQIQKRYVRKDGQLVWVLLTVTLASDLTGKPIHLIEQVQNITEKIETEEKLKQNEARFRMIFEKAEFGLAISDSNFKFIAANPAFCRMMGYSNEELSKLTFTDITHPSRRKEDTKNVMAMAKGTLSHYQTEKQYLKKDGTIFWGSLVTTTVRNNMGGAAFYIAMVQDISERKRLESELEKWGQVIKNADWGIAIGSPDEYILEAVNPAYARMHGYTVKELIGKPASIVYSKKSEVSLPEYTRLANKKGSHTFETLHVRKDGTIFPVQVNLTAVKDTSGKVMFHAVNVLDITNQKKIEKELLTAKEKAIEADKLKTAFLCNMSHEIRTPMNAIMGFAELIESNDLPVDKRSAYAGIINHRANDLLNVINDIIDVSKIEAGTLNIVEEPGFLNLVLEEIRQFFTSRNENLVKKPIDFRVKNKLKNEENKILSDFQRLKQVLINLVENALKFTSSGFIEIGCELTDNNRNILIHVKDTGIGIPKNKLTVIFDRFWQAEEVLYGKKHGGAGLGLSISKGIIELMKGKLWVESTVGKGSVFYFKIPYKFDENAIEPEIKKENVKFDWKDKTILLVEDTEYNADVIIEMLASTGVRIKVAKDGHSAIEQFQQNPNFDLILMDIRLPDISGIDVTKQIKKIRKDITVIAQTAYASDDDKVKCFNSGCQEFISKPINHSKMLTLLSRYLQ
jgi:two-component system, chemotaxis family, CheB/CheR fusion protein